MKTLRLELGERGYPIHIGHGLLGRAELIAPYIGGRRVAIVTNSVVGPLYLKSVERMLAAYDPLIVVLPDGEQTKTLATLERVIGDLLTARCENHLHGINDLDDTIRRLCGPSVAQLDAIGVRRVSVGSALARVAVVHAAQQLLAQGTVDTISMVDGALLRRAFPT